MDKFALPKRNVFYILIGLCIMVLGYVLMMGGGSEDPNVFSYEIFSFRRIVLAPIVIILGIVFEIFAIMSKKPISYYFKKRKKDEEVK